MVIKKRERLKANAFGFYPLRGEAVIHFGKDSREESFIEFLNVLREENPPLQGDSLNFGQLQNPFQQEGEGGGQEPWYQVALFASLLSRLEPH
jgi:hypothetical protein